VELALNPVCAGRTRHAIDHQLGSLSLDNPSVISLRS
ncbi:MAG: hypothetical protein ACI8XD_001480, partial [Thermoproteota archaeon]